MKKSIITLLLLGLSTSAALVHGATFDVTVTNITRGQIISPPIVVTHNADFRLFSVGEPASDGLAAVAEDADSAGLLGLLGNDDNVFEFSEAANGIGPGESVTVRINTGNRFVYISAAGMLVTSNDAFFGLNSARVSRNEAVTHRVVAYDAGSEANTEDCAHIPGPPCGNPFMRVTDGAEGFVHVHIGIHGIESLASEVFDWRNPVAQITIERATTD